MDKRTKHQRHKTLSRDELAEMGPGRASFDTEAGRAAQGMRPDIGPITGKEEAAKTPEAPPPVHTGNPPTDDDDVT